MIEVFKTNVHDPDQANMLVTFIHSHFNEYSANFDLQDCDRILRISSSHGDVNTKLLLRFLNECGIHAETLPD